MSEQETLQAFHEIVIPVDLGIETKEFRVPFTIEMLDRFEEALEKCEDVGWRWLRLKKSDKTILQACEDFCRPYLQDTDLRKVQPNFCLLFFSRVRAELQASMPRSNDSTASTAT